MAIDAAWQVINGAKRRLRRVASLDAHRAAAEAAFGATCPAARCAGDVASAAYLHPIAQSGQVGHIVRAAASAARVTELGAGNDPALGEGSIERARARASPVVIDVLCRYPPARLGNDRVARLMVTLDPASRALHTSGGLNPPEV
jgi:hypothetical protein